MSVSATGRVDFDPVARINVKAQSVGPAKVYLVSGCCTYSYMLSDEEITEYIERERIRNLKYRYIWAMDANDSERVLEVFTPDAVFYGQHKKTNEAYIRKSGHEELHAMVEERAARTDIDFINHRAYTPRIEIDGDSAYGYWYMTNIHSYPDGGVDFQFGYYADKYRKVEGEWKISHLTAEFILVDPARAE